MEVTLVVMATVLLSIFAHGLTAYPLAVWYGNQVEKMKDEPDMPEFEQITEIPLRVMR